MDRGLFGGDTALLLSEQCIDVVFLAHDSMLPNVKSLGQSFEMQQTTCQFKVRVGDGTGGVLSGRGQSRMGSPTEDDCFEGRGGDKVSVGGRMKVTKLMDKFEENLVM